MELVEGASLRQVMTRLALTQEALEGPDSIVAAAMTAQSTAAAERFDQPTADETPVTPVEHATADYVAPAASDRTSTLTRAAKKMRASAQYVQRCCEIVRDVAQALEYAHGAGVIHRDIKPENLMLDRHGQVHIIDFGLARFFDDLSITHSGQLVGTPLYMSPEQVTGRLKVDQRTDIYSLGMVLYEMLALRPAIEHTSRENLLRNIMTKALPPLSARNRSVPKALEAVVHKATHKDAEERYQSAREFAEDLERCLAGKPVNALNYHYRLDMQEIAGRRPAAVVLAAFLCFMAGCAVMVALVSIGIMTWFITGDNVSARLISAFQIVIGFIIGGVAAALSFGLLSGRNWVRWIAIVLSVLIAIACLAALYFLVRFAVGPLI
jgi:hypothetical protein